MAKPDETKPSRRIALLTGSKARNRLLGDSCVAGTLFEALISPAMEVRGSIGLWTRTMEQLRLWLLTLNDSIKVKSYNSGCPNPAICTRNLHLAQLLGPDTRSNHRSEAHVTPCHLIRQFEKSTRPKSARNPASGILVESVHFEGPQNAHFVKK